MFLVGVGTFGAPELLILLVIVLLLFGAGRISGLGRSLGQSIVEFRKASRDPDDEGHPQHEQADRRSAATIAAPLSVNGATDRDYRSAGTAPAPPPGTASRPPDFPGR